MPEQPPSSARLRHIGRTLRKIREDEGKTLSAVRRRLDRSPASMSAIENGLQQLRPRDLKYILYEYGVTDPLRSNLVELAEQERKPGWWLDFKDIASPADRDYASLEWHAARLDGVETRFIPGLFQTEEYARAIMLSSHSMSQLNRADRLVEFRMARQQILRKENPPQLRVIIDEAALRRARGGPDVMRGQLERLLEESYQDRISLRVLPFTCTEETGVSGPFWTLNIKEPTILSAVLISHMTGRWILEARDDIAGYQDAFERVRSVALSESDSRALLQRISSDL